MWKEQIDFRKIFDEIDKEEFSRTKEMISRMFSTILEGDTQPLGSNLPYYYGYQINVGPDGKPHVREFGNIRPSRIGLIEQSEIRKPLVDTNFNEKENTYVVTAEMPGVTKEDIKVSVSQQTVTIKADRGGKKYLAEIPLDVELYDASTKATYTNGIVEIKIKAKDQPKLKSKEIKVE
jgi:HSP20 family protein